MAGVGVMGSEEREYPSLVMKWSTPSMDSRIGYQLGLIF
jgi:hypothetical protein